MLVKDERSSWYSTVVDFLMLVWDRRKEIMYGTGSIGQVRQSAPLQSARSMAWSAVTVEYEFFYIQGVIMHEYLDHIT